MPLRCDGGPVSAVWRHHFLALLLRLWKAGHRREPRVQKSGTPVLTACASCRARSRQVCLRSGHVGASVSARVHDE